MGDDLELLQAWQQGDAKAGDLLIRRHFVPVYRFFSSKAPDHADDLAQRTFLACTKVKVRVDPEAGLRGYLFGIARRILFDHLRTTYRSIERDPESEGSIAQLTGQDPERVVSASEHEAVVLQALQRLPLDFQICLELFYWEDMSLAEIAAAIEVAPGTVKSRLSRGRTMMAEQLRRMRVRGKLHDATMRDLAGWTRSLGRKLGGGGR